MMELIFISAAVISAISIFTMVIYILVSERAGNYATKWVVDALLGIGIIAGIIELIVGTIIIVNSIQPTC